MLALQIITLAASVVIILLAIAGMIDAGINSADLSLIVVAVLIGIAPYLAFVRRDDGTP